MLCDSICTIYSNLLIIVLMKKAAGGTGQKDVVTAVTYSLLKDNHSAEYYQIRIFACNGMKSLPSPMSSRRIHRNPSGKSEFHGIPRNFNGKQLAGAPAISHSHSMEIPIFFQGILMETVGIPEPPGMIPMGICGILLEFP